MLIRSIKYFACLKLELEGVSWAKPGKQIKAEINSLNFHLQSMKEIHDIITAYEKANAIGQKTALATVVSVMGSSYRRPGARMLITDEGLLTGAISGGCLEGDALKKALSAIYQQENKLVTYDTSDDDDAKFGVQLGCNGIVHILFEPINNQAPNNPIFLLKSLQGKREDAAIVTLFSLQGKRQPGTLLSLKAGKYLGNSPETLPPLILQEIENALISKTSSIKSFVFENELIDGLVEFISPPISLIVAGAGNDAQPLVHFAQQLGWQVTVVDGRASHANRQRFETPASLFVGKPEQIFPKLMLDHQTAVVLMTHNYNYDTELLGLLLQTQAPYIGTLGPKTKLLKMLTELKLDTPGHQERIHGPVGLDIGAETAEEIAISIVAEIKAVLSGASGIALKDKLGPIHKNPVTSEL